MPFPTVTLLVAATSLAVYFDLTARRIPNWISASVLVYGIMAHVWIRGWPGLLESLVGTAVGGGILLVPHLLWGMGAGDVKLLAAVGSVVGPHGIVAVFILTGLAGGLLAILVLGLRKRSANIANRFVHMLISDPRVEKSLVGELPAKRSAALPYGIAISIGTWIFVGIQEVL
ncbi:MAG: prepilin peptidase [Acidobacteria bacterium]|nr:prepilin peptidase [Acidobacteriota bacterium]